MADCDMNGVSSLLKMRESSSSDRRNSGEEERGDDLDRKIVTIDVSILEASENKDAEEVEDLGDDGYVFSVGDFVWGKIKSHPWWPGRIYDPSDASDLALKLKQKNRQLLVAYFGDGTFAWCHPSQLKPFEENFGDMVKQSGSRAFINAVQDAVNQVGRLLNRKLTHSFVSKITRSEITLPLVKNSGIKGGVILPENLIDRLSDVTIEPPELLSQVKQFSGAISIAIASILELGKLKAQLSAFYLSRGSYRLPEYEDPQPVPGLEDSVVDDMVDMGNGKSAVKVPVQGPFEEDYSASAVSPKFGESQGLSGNGSNQRRKQKSMAEIMGEDKDAIWATGSKRRRENENAMALKSVQKRTELLLNTDENVSSADNDESEDKEESKGVKEAFDDENIGSGSKIVSDEGVKNIEQNEKGPLSRERKKSKYLSPPFTAPIKGLKKGNIEVESPKASSEAQASEGIPRSTGQPSPRVLKYNGEAVLGNDLKKVVEWELSDSSGDEKKTIDPLNLQVTLSEVLSELRYVGISPQSPMKNTSLVDFISVFRSSLYHEGSLYKVYQTCRPRRKRKKPDEYNPRLPSQGQNQSDHMSPILDLGPMKRRKNGIPCTPKAKKGADKNASAAALFVSFWPGSTLPSKSDLITIYSEFGSLNEEETDMFRTNYTARVCFLRTSDAETALTHSQNKNPFESSEVTFQLKYLSDALSDASFKSGGEHGERSKFKSSAAAAKTKEKASDIPQAVSLPQSEASRLNYIKGKLQGLTSMLEASDGKSSDVKAKVVSGMKGLLEDMDKMVGSSSS